ncbi:MAG: SDR family oxidoreductase [Bacteroidota bacterium]
MNNKIYISGCGGMLGDAFYKVFNDDFELRCTDIDVNEDWLEFCDIRDFDSYLKDVVQFDPDYLFHLGAYTDLEYCEKNPDEAYITNTLSVEHAVQIANELQIPLLYISTAGIFDGKKDVYDDWDKPNPLGVYARTKYLGERYVVENARKYFVCRAGWMMGGGPTKDKKFINKLIQQIKNGAKELNIVDDKLGTPTYTMEFANNVKELIKTNYYGVYNMVCQGVTDRLAVSKHLLKVLNRSSVIDINEVSSEFFRKEYFAPRPESERLINKKLQLRKLNLMGDWEVALKEYVETSFSDVIKK